MAFDLLLKNARVVDGSGNPAFPGDLGVVGDRIAAVGRSLDGESASTLDLKGLVLAPGFIDMHSHSDLELASNGVNASKVLQGVTLDIVGQDGLSYVPATTEAIFTQLRLQLRGWNGDRGLVGWPWRTVNDYLGELDRGMVANAAYLVPHGNLRLCAMGTANRQATSIEIDRMCGLLSDGMEQGAVGLSAGLTYAPGMYADDAELVALCREVASLGGFFAPHHRNYGAGAMNAYADCLEIARKAGVALHLTHSHLSFEVNAGRAEELLDLVDDALDEGLDVTMDSYPYLAGATYLHAFLPSWVQEGGHDATLRRLSDPVVRGRIRSAFDLSDGQGSDGFHGEKILWNDTVISGVGVSLNEQYVGKSLALIAEEMGSDFTDAYCDLLIADELGTSCVFLFGNEDNVRAIMQHPVHMPASDGVLVGSRPHPRAWGTFARYLAKYVRELRVLRLEDCVRKMTSLPAIRLSLFDRGLVREGMIADLVCFDPGKINDVATYERPQCGPEGVALVVVNGQIVADSDGLTGVRAGRSVRQTPAAGSRGQIHS